VLRAGLTRDRVVDEAERIADDVGLSRLTLTALAERLGVRQPSLYKHVDGMDGLQRSIAVRAKNELTDILARAAVGRSRGDAVVSMSREYRHWALDHPGRYAAAQRAPVAEDAEDEAAGRAVVQVCTAFSSSTQVPMTARAAR
jgi:AcrR family transcriptional regulator